MKNYSIATKTIAAMMSVQRAGVARDNRDMFVYIVFVQRVHHKRCTQRDS